MKKLCVLIYVLLLFSPHSVFAEDKGVIHHEIGHGVTINGMRYGFKIECEEPFNAYLDIAQCADQKQTIDVAILSSVSLAESKKQGNKILGCFKAAMFFLHPYDWKKGCGKSKFAHYKVFDSKGVMLLKKATPIIYLPPEK